MTENLADIPNFGPSAVEQNPPHTATGSGKDLRNLDVLRAVAVLCVFVHHLLHALHMTPYGMGFGGFGVGLFFVHTALVLMWSLERRPSAADFYIRRIARIYPLAMVALCAAVVLHARVSTYGAEGPFFLYIAPTLKQFATHLLLVQNLFSGNFVIYTMWSLPLEVQMYALLPLLFFFLRWKRSLWPLLLLWLVCAAVSAHYFGADRVNFAVSIPFFLPGLMAYVGFTKRKPHWSGWAFLPVLGGLVWLGGYANDWRLAWLPCLALGLLLPSFRQLPENFFTKACWQIARYSYGIYLIHPFSLALAFYVCKSYSRPFQFGVLFTSLTVLSIAAFHCIEAPGMRLGARLAGRFVRPAGQAQQPAAA